MTIKNDIPKNLNLRSRSPVKYCRDFTLACGRDLPILVIPDIFYRESILLLH